MRKRAEDVPSAVKDTDGSAGRTCREQDLSLVHSRCTIKACGMDEPPPQSYAVVLGTTQSCPDTRSVS